jgi:NADH:ubiquinone oxidoreductase subunit 5 (subunit L)/multisubunit Na+/H+ antiporter MnhA subunit
MVVNSRRVILLLVVDWVSVFFLSTVSLIAGRVIFYSSSYISRDVYYSRFIGLVIIFVIRI